MVGAAPVDDFGARDLWPFCPWPQKIRPKRGGKAGPVEIAFARNGDPDDVVELIPTSTAAGTGHRARVVDPLSWYASRKPAFFPAILVQAGRQFQDDFEWLACKSGPPVPDPGRPVVVTNSTPGPPALIDELVERRAVLDQALEYVGGPELDRLLVDVVGQSKPLPEFERRHGYPTGSGQLGLRIALYRLTVFYGLVSRHWKP